MVSVLGLRKYIRYFILYYIPLGDWRIAVHFEDIFFGDGCEGASREKAGGGVWRRRMRLEEEAGGGVWRRRLEATRAAGEELIARQLQTNCFPNSR